MAVRQETQVLDLNQLIEHWCKSYDMPANVTVVNHHYLLDPVEKKVVLTMVLDVEPPVEEE